MDSSATGQSGDPPKREEAREEDLPVSPELHIRGRFCLGRNLREKHKFHESPESGDEGGCLRLSA